MEPHLPRTRQSLSHDHDPTLDEESSDSDETFETDE